MPTLIAEILDPSNNGFDITDIATIVAIIGGAAAIAAGLVKWFSKQLRKVIREEIAAYTKPIQPEANGGLSLPDVARATHRTQVMLARLSAKLGYDVDEYDEL